MTKKIRKTYDDLLKQMQEIFDEDEIESAKEMKIRLSKKGIDIDHVLNEARKLRADFLKTEKARQYLKEKK